MEHVTKYNIDLIDVGTKLTDRNHPKVWDVAVVKRNAMQQLMTVDVTCDGHIKTLNVFHLLRYWNIKGNLESEKATIHRLRMEIDELKLENSLLATQLLEAKKWLKAVVNVATIEKAKDFLASNCSSLP